MLKGTQANAAFQMVLDSCIQMGLYIAQNRCAYPAANNNISRFCDYNVCKSFKMQSRWGAEIENIICEQGSATLCNTVKPG